MPPFNDYAISNFSFADNANKTVCSWLMKKYEIGVRGECTSHAHFSLFIQFQYVEYRPARKMYDGLIFSKNVTFANSPDADEQFV